MTVPDRKEQRPTCSLRTRGDRLSSARSEIGAMKRGSLTMVGVALLSVFGTAQYSRGGPEKDPDEARRSLKQEGFKTDLSDFNFLTDAATASGAAALTNAVHTRPPVLLQPC